MICFHCNQDKPKQDFWKNNTKSRGYQTWCKLCQKHVNGLCGRCEKPRELSDGLCRACKKEVRGLYWKEEMGTDLW